VATLVFALFWEYDITPDLTGPDTSAAWREMRDHVILPILVLIVPTLIATPGDQPRAAPAGPHRPRHRHRARPARVRLPVEELPVEVAPFVGSINQLLARLDSRRRPARSLRRRCRPRIAHPAGDHGDAARRSPPARPRPLRREIAAMNRLVEQLLLLMAQIEAEAATRAPPPFHWPPWPKTSSPRSPRK
jgi:hypothetical protein